MSRGRPDAAALVAGVALAVGALAVLAPVAHDPGLPSRADGWYARTLLAWPLVAVLVLASAAALRAAALPRGARPARLAAAGALVVGLAAAGAGAVAARHWEPATGTGSMALHTLRAGRLASLVLAAAGVAAALAAATVLLSCRPRRASGLAPLAIALGLALAVAVPVVIARADPLGVDVTSLGAIALLTGAPWAAALVLSAALSDAEGAAIAWACAALAALQAIAGLLVRDVGGGRATLVLAAAVLAALALARARAAARAA